MKKNILVIFYLLAISHMTFAQNLLWSKKIIPKPEMCISKGLISDKNGIVYSYGSQNLVNNYYQSYFLADTVGSFLQGYSNNGVLIFSKRWAIPFCIQKMVYDGNQYFYFTATFSGTQIIDGITITSQGNTDGITGKMDLTGRIIWMKTFGGGGSDQGNGICFNSADNSVYATGSIKDTLFFNNTFESISQQSAIILHYSSTGTLINYKLYDFVPNRNVSFINSGREICQDQSGFFFLLMDRDGRLNYGDSITGPIRGSYIIKLNSNLDTIWSTYINGGAYDYGCTRNNLRTASNGDVYIVSRGNGKYGGLAKVSRLNGNTGQIFWNYTNNDGTFIDLFIDVNTVFLLGNEGAIGCPCQASTPGYYVLKKFDANNPLVGETRFFNVQLNNITKDVSGNLFATGEFGEKAIIGHDTLIGGGRFLTKLGDINCTAPVISVSVPSYYGHYHPICAGDEATLTVNLTQGTFDWSNGDNGTQTQVDSAGFYSVRNTQPNGCKAYSLPINIKMSSICPGAIFGNTTVCSGSLNTYSIDTISGVSIYTWTLPSGWIGSSTSNSITAIASAIGGNISVLGNIGSGSSAPRTIIVTVPTIDTTVTQASDTLTANMPNANYVWLDCNNNAAIANAINQDFIPTASGNYAVIITKNNCMDTSACKNFVMTGIVNVSVETDFSVFPNPTNNFININYKSNELSGGFYLEIKNIVGQTIYTSSVSSFQGEYKKAIDLSEESPGIYFVQIIADRKTIVKKIILN